jgi:SAM-dependent methyltransferase
MGNLTYGEITIKGSWEFASLLKPFVKPDSTFVDVGSGYGKLVQGIAEFLDIKTVGIEIDKAKHNIAKKIKWSNRRDNITLIQGDFTKKENLEIIRSADLVFADNVTWSSNLNNILIRNCTNHLFLMKYTGIEPKVEAELTADISVSWFKDKKSKLYKINTNAFR